MTISFHSAAAKTAFENGFFYKPEGVAEESATCIITRDNREGRKMDNAAANSSHAYQVREA